MIIFDVATAGPAEAWLEVVVLCTETGDLLEQVYPLPPGGIEVPKVHRMHEENGLLAECHASKLDLREGVLQFREWAEAHPGPVLTWSVCYDQQAWFLVTRQIRRFYCLNTLAWAKGLETKAPAHGRARGSVNAGLEVFLR